MSSRSDAAAELADELIQLLEAQRKLGSDFYPLRLRRLLEMASQNASATLIQKVLAKRTFQRQVAVGRAKSLDTPIALASDLESLAGSRLLLEFMLQSLRTPSNQAFSAAQLKAKTSRKLQISFQAALRRQIDEGSLPPAVGWLMIQRTKKLLLLADLHTRGQASGVTALRASAEPSIRGERAFAEGSSATSFAQTFDQTFAQLDRRAGAHNFVSLVDLRAALPVSREVFDRELQQLRLAGCYGLSSSEGRHGLSPEEAAAAISEDGTLLLYVSRKMP
jgi:hypothetical protein